MRNNLWGQGTFSRVVLFEGQATTFISPLTEWVHAYLSPVVSN